MFIYFTKEIRQLRRNLVFWIVLAVQIMLSFAIMYLMYKYLESEDLYSPFYRALGILTAFLIAINSGMRWCAEKSDDALNPFVTTPLSPVRVVAEKYLVSAIVVLLPLVIAQIFAASTAPKELTQYLWLYLFPTDMAAMLLSAALILTIASACGKHGILGSVLPGVLLLLVMVLAKQPMGGFRAFSADGNVTIFTMLYTLLPIMLLFALTNAAVSPASSDRMIPARFALLLTLTANAVVVMVQNRNDLLAKDVIFIIAAICRTGAIYSVIAAIAERHAQSRRIAAEIRRLPAVLRPLRALCSTGAITEVIYSLVLAAAAEILLLCSGDRSWDFPFSYAMYLFSAACPLMISCLVKRGSNERIHPSLLYLIAWGTMMILFLVGLVLFKLVSDTDAAARYMTAVLGIMALVMLIPTAQEFTSSLKRR